MLTAITLNVNGVHSRDKCVDLWNAVPQSDIICFQETHLHPDQEYAFKFHAHSYDFFFSHGSTSSAGIVIAVRQN